MISKIMDGCGVGRGDAWVAGELADLEAEEFNSANQALWRRGLLIRRHIADCHLAFLTTWCPAGTSSEAMVAVEGGRWAIEDSFENAKNEFGFDHKESKSWHGWRRNVSPVMLGFAMMRAICDRANPLPPKKKKRYAAVKNQRIATPPLIPGQSRKSAVSPSDSLESAFGPLMSSHSHSGVRPKRRIAARSSQKTITVMLRTNDSALLAQQLTFAGGTRRPIEGGVAPNRLAAVALNRPQVHGD